MSRLTAPWTAEQVGHLNAFQRSWRMHPFTCGQRSVHPEDEGVLVATETGWWCPAEGCDYQQDWAHPFMARPLPPDAIYDALTASRDERQRGRNGLASVARVRALHQPYRSVYDTDGQSCAHCNQLTGYAVPYPCDTIKAIGGEL